VDARINLFRHFVGRQRSKDRRCAGDHFRRGSCVCLSGDCAATLGIRPNVEGIQEITVETNSYAPEVGRPAGGVVNVVTKSGSNQFHGSAYEYFRNDKTDSYTHFANKVEPKPEMRHNQYGVSFGGRIFKNETFFYGDWEGLREIQGGTTYTESVPAQDQYNAIPSLNGSTPQDLVNAGIGTAGYTSHSVEPVTSLVLYNWGKCAQV